MDQADRRVLADIFSRAGVLIPCSCCQQGIGGWGLYRGQGWARILVMVLAVLHLPNVLHLALVSASLQVLAAIKFEVILTYLGVGVQDGSSWGSMISDATGELVQGIWWPLAGVVLAMFVLIYALNVIGDALRDALDPRLLDK